MRLAQSACILGFAMLGSAMLAQHALDANLQRGSNRQNPAASQRAMARPVFTVNQQTGEMMHNRANAFNDPVYNIYQRHTSNRFGYFSSPSGQQAGRSSAPVQMPGPAPGGSVASLSRPAYSAARSYPMPMSIPSATRSSGLVTARRVQPQSLAARRYSPLRVSTPVQATPTRWQAR